MYRLLQLRGVVGHSATAYQAAKEGLERIFGGQIYQVAIYLEAIL